MFVPCHAIEKAGGVSAADSEGGPGARPPLPPRLSKIMQFSGLREKPLFQANFGLKAPLGIKTPMGPLT